MPDPATTRRVLARLAERPVDRLADTSLFEDDPSHRSVVDTASSATDRLDDAAAFLEAGGLTRLEDAIETAADAGDHAAARRGRRAREQLQALRSALDDSQHSGVAPDAETVPVEDA